jgi:hypothetical protein
MGEFVNSKQARFDQSMVSCGVMEMHHLPDWSGSKLCFAMANALYHKANPRPTAFVLWSDSVEETLSGGAAACRGGRLASFLNTFPGAGKLFESATAVNPKTGNRIKVWLLHVDHDVLRKYYQEELANRIEQD